MATKPKAASSAMRCVVDELIHAELCGIVGGALHAAGFIITPEALDLVAEDGDMGPTGTGDGHAKAIGRLALEGDAVAVVRHARDLQSHLAEDESDPTARSVERLKLAIIDAHLAGNRRMLGVAVEAYWLIVND